MAVSLAILAACAFALGSVLQQKGTMETPAGEEDPRFLVQVLRRPVWLVGGGMQLAGWVLQAAALDRGALVVVQALTSLSLVIALPLGAWITSQEISRPVWLGAGAMVAGIALFLSVGVPQSGSSTPSASAWWSAGVTSLVVVVILGILGRRRHGVARALTVGFGCRRLLRPSGRGHQGVRAAGRPRHLDLVDKLDDLRPGCIGACRFRPSAVGPEDWGARPGHGVQ